MLKLLVCFFLLIDSTILYLSAFAVFFFFFSVCLCFSCVQFLFFSKIPFHLKDLGVWEGEGGTGGDLLCKIIQYVMLKLEMSINRFKKKNCSMSAGCV